MIFARHCLCIEENSVEYLLCILIFSCNLRWTANFWHPRLVSRFSFRLTEAYPGLATSNNLIQTKTISIICLERCSWMSHLYPPIWRHQHLRDPLITDLAVTKMMFQNLWNAPWCNVKCTGNLLNGYLCVFVYCCLHISGHLFVHLCVCVFFFFFFLSFLSFTLGFFKCEISTRKMFYPEVHHRTGRRLGMLSVGRQIMLGVDLLSMTFSLM